MKPNLMNKRYYGGVIIITLFSALLFTGSANAAPLPGAIFTTNNTCTGVDLNIYSSKDAVYLDGGPTHPGAAGLPDGVYYVQVTDPSGTPVLGTSVGSGNETPVTVASGEFSQCYQLSSIVFNNGVAGYADTPNSGGEYKVWVSTVPTFDNDSTKTDNFKVKSNTCIPPDPSCGDQPPAGVLNVLKFYDANANGSNDTGETLLDGWKVRITDDPVFDNTRFTPVHVTLDPATYSVSEFDTIQTNWVHTTDNPVQVTIANGDDKTVEFGNVCLGTGGGLTLGYWSNKNGQAAMSKLVGGGIPMLDALNLVDGSGNAFDPGSYSAFRTWLLNATATNMAYMLSAQLAAMELNVASGSVSSSVLVYTPGLMPFAPIVGLNSLGFISINDLMTAANSALLADPNSPSGSPDRAYQEALKNALDKANNNGSFVQATPCAYTFN